MCHPPKSDSNLRAFTLVELLVVIGIIALLISVLLPALSTARRQAACVKCAASLRDIDNAFVMYAMDNRGYAPPSRLFGTTSSPYSLYDFVFFTTNGQLGGTGTPTIPPYWYNFLSKYVTKTHVGFSATNSSQVAMGQQNIFWGCPSWSGYVNNGSAVTNPLQISIHTGYGMNQFPEYSPTYPPDNVELGESSSPPYGSQVNTPGYLGSDWSHFTNTWYKFSAWQKHGTDRALVGDCMFWFCEARPPLQPPQMAAQYILSNAQVWSIEPDYENETTLDFYRHGVYPRLKAGTTDEFDIQGGKIAYNVLFCDGHVSTLLDQQSGYRAVRMKYPG